VIGRLCTPDRRKWPDDVVPFYAALAARCPFIKWEFVGCPRELQGTLTEACGGRTVFYTAAWERRELYGSWDALVYHHPTLTESFGRTVAEAMRAGCVPIVDRKGGFCEQLDAGGGFLCDRLEDFVRAIELLRDARFRWIMSHRARCIADSRWSLEAVRRRLLRVVAPCEHTGGRMLARTTNSERN
jgi:glycosyltransferase involved in cell wall biosynthesis